MTHRDRLKRMTFFRQPKGSVPRIDPPAVRRSDQPADAVPMNRAARRAAARRKEKP